jgi:hypothetical protein
MVIRIETEISIDKDVAGGVRRAQRQRLKDSAQYGLNNAVNEAPEDRGQLTNDLIDPEWRNGKLLWGFNAPYAHAQEFGTEPYFPPLQPLLEWSERVSGGTGLGYYVARVKIPTEGIEEKGFARHGRDKQVQWLKSNGLSDYLEREFD